jgi:hypothetical protein
VEVVEQLLRVPSAKLAYSGYIVHLYIKDKVKLLEKNKNLIRRYKAMNILMANQGINIQNP